MLQNFESELSSEPNFTRLQDDNQQPPQGALMGHTIAHRLCELARLETRKSKDSPEKPAFTFLAAGETPVSVDTRADVQTLTFAQLHGQSLELAKTLLPHTGESVLLLFPSGLEFLVGFFACLYAGCKPVPLSPPFLKRQLDTMLAVAAHTKARVGLTAPLFARHVQNAPSAGLAWKTLDCASATPLQGNGLSATDLDALGGFPGLQKKVDLTQTAFVQFTSGSTGQPKGVAVSHANLNHNQRSLQAWLGLTSQSVVGSWLPQFHDMGLVGKMLHAIWVGCPSVFMDPAYFMQRPLRWLELVSHYRVTISGGPNFAYAECVRRIRTSDCQGLDLSGWELALNGAEPVRLDTMRAFAQTFAHLGFQTRAFAPCYGLAEATLFVTGKPVGTDILAAGKPNVATFASSGLPVLDTRVAIVDPETLSRVAPGQVGEIWLQSNSRAQHSSDQTGILKGEEHADTWLRTGDLGYQQRETEDLCVIGRLKDTVVVRGKNHSAADLEHAMQNSDAALRPFSGAVFAIDDVQGTAVVAIQEIEREWIAKLDTATLAQKIIAAVTAAHGIGLDAVLLVKPGRVPKTSSGKVRRSQCREEFLAWKLGQNSIWSDAVIGQPFERTKDLQP